MISAIIGSHLIVDIRNAYLEWVNKLVLVSSNDYL